ncbi:unnamed protein product [Schistosoma mattheei]|uniref:Uncharacterized protein n=1 Tax=Schistosoma mattheei TaxID=31246 RepID=A0A183PS93_9TREM|nr:unnamed protein product [Schistosoma mattheei]
MYLHIRVDAHLGLEPSTIRFKRHRVIHCWSLSILAYKSF